MYRFNTHTHTGNYYNKGDLRKQELYRSAAILGIHSHHVTILGDKNLPDNPDVDWHAETINMHISQAIREKQIQTVSVSMLM